MSIVPTGVPGLDQMLNGGFPKSRVVLVVGGPGAGKTIIGAQFLYKGITEYDENGIYISLDENKEHFQSEMRKFGWDFKKVEEEEKFAFIDATTMSRVAALREKVYGEISTLRGKQLPIDKLVEQLDEKIKQIDAKRVVLDTLATLFHRFPDPIERRIAVIDLIESLSELKITTIVTTELNRRGLDRTVSVEEYMIHGVIMMQTLFSEGVTSRALQVEKMRETKINPNLVPYTIDKDGIEVFPEVTLFERR
ncbi:AAA family ATPase [Candidatus Bathyarchaeota archaeon]|nr:AAA family ATPase [Candidatus Bathyarchaeota archaeon]